jgi:coproporphyrinogen III oxidase
MAACYNADHLSRQQHSATQEHMRRPDAAREDSQQTMAAAANAQRDTRRAQVGALLEAAQQRLCAAFEQREQQAPDGPEALPPAAFECYSWQRPNGGYGTARVLSEGRVFERAGVNVSAVYGEQVPQSLWHERPALQGQPYFATGISLVLHPRNPYVPAFHANYRYFDVGDDWWFGGGMDLTPCYGFAEDAAFFHRTLRDYCARHPVVDYAVLKQACDDYFYIRHRGEMRGIGGIFFDHLHPQGSDGWERAFAFMQEGTAAIADAYLPLVQRRMQQPYGERERAWQLYRRGRYVEFNLVYDRGTIFGLQTGGDTEAILMSLPPLVRWAFRAEPEPGSPEAALTDFVQPRPWAEEAI